jgi:diguanylate cyclase (GGDEF)-like protein
VEFENFFPEPENVVTVTISVGVTEYYNKESLSAFIKRADQAMYLSKEKGRNAISFLFAESS